MSYKAFFDTLDAKGRSLLRFLHPPDADLSPPLALRDSTQILREIMSVYESTLISNDDPHVEEDFARILDAAVDPPLEMCRRMADLRKGEGGDWEKAVFLANCVGYLEVSLALKMIHASTTLTDTTNASSHQHVLESYSFTTSRVHALQDQMDRHVKLLADEHVRPPIFACTSHSRLRLIYLLQHVQFQRCLDQSGLSPVIKALHEKDDTVRPASV